MSKRSNIYKNIFESSPIPRLIGSVDEKGIFTFETVNQAACDYFSITKRIFAKKYPEKIFKDKELAQYIKQAFETCARVKQTITVQSIAEIIGNPEIHAFIFNPLMDAENKVAQIDMIARMNLPHNIQLRRERDDAISLLSSIFDTSTVGILVVDRHHRIIRLNDVFVYKFGWQRSDLIGEKLSNLVLPEDLKKFSDDIRESEKTQAREAAIKCANGGFIDVLITTAFLELSHNRRFKIITMLDISEQKKMEASLIEAKEEAEIANKAKTAFLANMSHELRTPLNAIIGFTELIKNGTFGPVENKKYQEYLTDIHYSAEHLLDIINDVLDMSKIEAGKVEINESQVDMIDLFQSVERIMHDRISNAQLDLVVNIQPQMPALIADRRWILQMLMNLVSNSIKFSPAGSKIIVESNVIDNDCIRITVTDFGRGIDDSKITKVLEPFGQAAEPATNAGQGTGLGLPLAKAMAELHGGKLILKSSVGKGTVVHLDFPAERTYRKSAAQSDKPAQPKDKKVVSIDFFDQEKNQ